MNILNSRMLRSIEKMVDLFLLNLIWLIFCLPVVTIFPATTAMYGVIRKWVMGKETDGVFRSFFKLFRECFFQSMGISILWFVLAYLIFLDYQLVHSNLLMMGILGLLTLLFLSITVYLFPVMAHLETSWKYIIRNSLIMAISYPVSTLLLIGVLLISMY
ncbi:YesL family protein, partial [Neobacillus drentensis]|uniref:YesL family protein n=1 Tax=Neobacillus drentensis TaxID=220684 RepID=UPI002FFF6A3D